MEQRSPEWFNARRGKVTASRIADLTAKRKDGMPAASRANYLTQLMLERITGRTRETYQSPAMIEGTMREPFARSHYMLFHDAEVAEVGFVEHPTIAMAGASPDGLVGEHGLVEFKCPADTTHLDFINNPKIDSEYIKQIQFQLACTGRQWCDFASFHPEFEPVRARMIVVRVERHPAQIETIETEVREFLAELDAKVSRYKERFGL